jgi:hypothetical protein
MIILTYKPEGILNRSKISYYVSNKMYFFNISNDFINKDQYNSNQVSLNLLIQTISNSRKGWKTEEVYSDLSLRFYSFMKTHTSLKYK